MQQQATMTNGSHTDLTLPPVEMAQLRQALYRFMGMLFLYPDSFRLAKVKKAANELLAAKPTWASLTFSIQLNELLTILVGLTDEATEQMEVEYNDLLRVKPRATPYESFYVDPEGQARGMIAAELETEYANAGLSLSPSLQDMPDHISVELEFMSFLCGQEVEARATTNEAENVQGRIRQRAFLNMHLVRWFPRFARQITDAAPHNLYHLVAAVAYAFLRHDLAYLGLRKR